MYNPNRKPPDPGRSPQLYGAPSTPVNKKMKMCLSPFGAVVLLAVSGVVEGGGSYGQFCSDKHACENGGTCDPTGSSDSGSCTCPTGYTGDRCQKR
ncbi:putative EGF-like and EMI domain-containing protein 1 [Haliotis rubra]|uniref:putative EGF-like and EMI domain-containing protein 1 n=1 Tax=Haliotis rubra TaxID=36100 RepID=UPI001EE56005|nr:putative EGF-like and EMI domain-containing protein 1 [Haliotis rubra]